MDQFWSRSRTPPRALLNRQRHRRFLVGTLVRSATGQYVPIEDLEVHDEVHSITSRIPTSDTMWNMTSCTLQARPPRINPKLDSQRIAKIF